MRATEAAWAAGFIDGEGCIAILHSVPANSYALTVQVCQKNRKPLDKLAALFGGEVQVYKTRPYFHWNLYAGNAARVLGVLLPYLVLKREQAELGLAFQSRRAHRSLHDRPLDEHAHAELRRLKTT